MGFLIGRQNNAVDVASVGNAGRRSCLVIYIEPRLNIHIKPNCEIDSKFHTQYFCNWEHTKKLISKRIKEKKQPPNYNI